MNPVQISFYSIQKVSSIFICFISPSNVGRNPSKALWSGGSTWSYTYSSRCRNSISFWNGKLQFPLQLSKIDNYYFLNNKSQHFFGFLDQSRRIKLAHLSKFSRTIIKREAHNFRNRVWITVFKIQCLTSFTCLHL